MPGYSNPICPNGHDRRITGERKNGNCKVCHLIRNEVSRQKRIARQAGRPRPEACECCGNVPAPGERKLAFDHDHKTGQFRGWLCGRCNTALGLARESIEILLKLALYLERTRCPSKPENPKLPFRTT